MGKNLLLALLLIVYISGKGQGVRLQGNVNDTAVKQPLPNALLMAVTFRDSTLVGYTRSNAQGQFNTIRVPLDTYIVIISHPSFNDKTYLLVPSEKDTVFNFKNVALPPQSVVLNEVEVFAYKDKSYYKGDTLIFTADSFKTRANATVEDLLKKLPGMRVDAEGKITVQGKKVDKVLVDGDEFFGSDPTIATRNLNASSVENVQVYDKKKETVEEGKSETEKIVNLKLKDDAKKGYFGKISGASDFTKFYENELLLNKFKGNQKLSLFGLAANTPKEGFGFQDAYKYGLTGENNMMYDEESGTQYYMGNQGNTGVPKTIKSGFYFGDKLGKKTKINTDYTFNQSNLLVVKETNTQVFLQDTSYTNASVDTSKTQNQSHVFNFTLVQKIDSLTEFTAVPKLKYNLTEGHTIDQNDFLSKNDVLTRRTLITNNSSGENSDVNVQLKLKRKFKKKDRQLILNYQPSYVNGFNNNQLITNYRYFLNQENDSDVVQKRRQSNYKFEQNAGLTWTEPLNKKFKTEWNYNFTQSKSNTNRSTFNTQQGSDVFNQSQSNNFDNARVINKAGVKLIYDVKKYQISLGGNYRTIHQENLNLTTKQKISVDFNNVLPLAGFVYRISQGSNLNMNYSGSSQQPDIKQMQPVVDNSNPNMISLGNPALKPTFRNNLNVNYYMYKGVTDVYIYSGLSMGNVNNQVSTKTTFNALGSATTQPINVNGNYYGNLYLGGGFPVFKRFMKIYYELNVNHNNNVSYVNDVKNSTQTSAIAPNLTFDKTTDKFEVSVKGDYSYNVPQNNLNTINTKPYYTYGFSGNLLLKFPKKFSLSGSGNYTNNGNRASGYNLNYFILNASINKTLLKSQNLVVSFEANDLLNQNISNTRSVSSNQIIDNKTNIIKRYFLLKVLLKLNSNKVKAEGEDDE